jgi:phosphoribosylformylglycinamidine cyclo-ligase
MAQPLSYDGSGVDIDAADSTKRAMAEHMTTSDPRVLNRLGAFATLFEATFPNVKHPVLVLKTEEPGSKQLLAIQHGKIASLAEDLVHHLVNDIAVMGAIPLSIQDCIVCGKLEKSVITEFVGAMAQTCRALGCTLTGGETSEQPGVLDAGRYILSASVVGVVEKDAIVDGGKIREGDMVLAVASNGLHTNGYSLVRKLIETDPKILEEKIEQLSFLEVILLPHTSYLAAIQAIAHMEGLTGLAHITGGGIAGNLNRILPKSLDARIDASIINVLPIFQTIKARGSVSDADMLKTFNVGVGLTIVCRPDVTEKIRTKIEAAGHRCYPIGSIAKGSGNVTYKGSVKW